MGAKTDQKIQACEKHLHRFACVSISEGTTLKHLPVTQKILITKVLGQNINAERDGK